MGKKKTTTQATETSRSVTTPTQPEWVSTLAQGLGRGIQRLGDWHPGGYAAPTSGLERQAAEGAAGLSTGEGETPFARPGPQVQGASLLDNLSAYYNPYRDQVTQAALADYDAEAARTRAAQDLSLAQQSAFRGSGAALTRSLTESELARARSAQQAKLLQDMFVTSAGLAGQDADRRQQASQANAQLARQDAQARAQFALDQDANRRANIAAQSSLGQQLRAADQAQRQAPYDALGRQVDMFSGLPLNLFQGQIAETNGSRTGSETTSDYSLGQIGSLLGPLSALIRSPK